MKNRSKTKKPFDSIEDKLYDEWFRKEVQKALDDPSPLIPHEEVWDHVLEYAQKLQDERNKIVDTTK